MKIISKLREKLAIFIYGEDFITRYINKHNEFIKYENKFYQELAKAKSYQGTLDQLHSIILELSDTIGNIEEDYSLLSCKYSKRMLDLEERLTNNNNIFYEKTKSKDFRQGDSYSISEEISMDFHEFGFYPLFHKYSLHDLHRFLISVNLYNDSSALSTLTFAYLHQKRLDEEKDGSAFNENLVIKANRIKNTKCEFNEE